MDRVLMNWQQTAAAVRWNLRPFIDGRYRSSSAIETFDDINPANETVLCRVAVGSAADIDEAVRVGRRRFDDGCWSGLPPAYRSEVLRKLADRIVEHKTELALLDCLEMGRPIASALQDAERCAATLRHWAAMGDKLYGATLPLSGNTLALNIYEPRGVVGAITAWNFPQHNAVMKCAPALAAGNSVVLKPSELSMGSALKLAELAIEAGLPEGVLNVVPGLGSTVGSALALHPDVDLLSFTGSSATGRKIMELSGRSNAKPLLLECGGKSPQLVFDDVNDLERVAAATVYGLVRNQGQVCSAHTRLIVQDSIKEALLEKVVHGAKQHHPGDPLDEKTTFGPLASPAQRDRVKAYIEQGLEAGAAPVLKGQIQEHDGCYVSPAIFDRVDGSMSIVAEEIFGPVLCVQSFESEEEAVALANATEYGLVAGVWTQNMGRSKRLARAIRAGHITVRSGGAEGPDLNVLSFEPQKASGIGMEIGIKGLEAYSILKSVQFVGA
jgi:acyl-CoA reductase-like NAD-dependent aldehyde dehydrogenase